MDSFKDFVEIKKYKEMTDEEKLHEFYGIEGNSIQLNETDTAVNENGETVITSDSRIYHFLQEEDLENEMSWNYEQLQKEMNDQAMIEGRSITKERMEALAESKAKLYGGMSDKDRKKALKEYRAIMRDKIGNLTKAYVKRKKGRADNKISVKTRMSYEKELIELNSQARDKFYEGMQTSEEDLRYNLMCSRMRRDYQLLRMYVYHFREGRMTKKEKEKYLKEYRAVRQELKDALQTFSRTEQNEKLRLDFRWNKVTGVYDMKEGLDNYALRKKKEQYKEEREERELEEEYRAALERERNKTPEERKAEELAAKQKAEEVAKNLAAALKLQEEENKKAEALRKKKEEKLAKEEEELRKKEEAKKLKERKKKQKKAGQNRAAWAKYLRTGTWDDRAKELKEGEQPVAEEVKEGWALAGSYEAAMKMLDQEGFDDIDNATFRAVAQIMNENLKKNWEKFTWKKEPSEKNGRKIEGEKRDWQKQLIDDQYTIMNYHLKGNKREREKQKQRMQDKINSYQKLFNLHYPEVEDQIKSIYHDLFKNDMINLLPDGEIFFSPLVARDLAEVQEERFAKLDAYCRRLDILEKNLNLSLRGERILRHEVIHQLIISDKMDDPKETEELFKHAKAIDKLIHRMAEKQYGALAGEAAYEGLREFLGEKALFGSYRQVRDLSERYLDGLSLTNMRAARLDQDFATAFEAEMGGSFARDYKDFAQKYLIACGFARRTEKDMQKVMKKYLNTLAKMLKSFQKACEGKKLRAEDWEYIRGGTESQIMRTANYAEPVRVDSKWLVSLKDLIAREIDKRAQKNESAQAVSYEQWMNSKKEQQLTNAGYSEVDEFSYRGQLMGEELLESKELRDVVADPKMRAFLAENLSSVILGNPELEALVPALKGKKSLDELDEIPYTEFLKISDALKVNMQMNKKAIKKLLDEGSDDKDMRILQMRRHVLLDIFRKKEKGTNISSILKAELKKHEDTEELKRHRLEYMMGRDTMQRDGTIKYRYEDMHDRSKGILKTYFGKGKAWLSNRVKKFEQAAGIWNKLEELSPQASEQVRSWMRDILKEEDNAKLRGRLNDLAKGLSGGKEALEKAGFKVDDGLAGIFAVGGGDLIDAILDVFKDEKDLAKCMEELSFCNNQDILYSHGCVRQGGLFENYGKEDDYRDMLLRDARFANSRMEIMERYLRKYEGNPKLQKQLRDKLTNAYFVFGVDIHEGQKRRTTKLKTVEEQRAELEEKYNKELKEFDEGLNMQVKKLQNDRDEAAATGQMIKDHQEALEHNKAMLDEEAVSLKKMVEEDDVKYEAYEKIKETYTKKLNVQKEEKKKAEDKLNEIRGTKEKYDIELKKVAPLVLKYSVEKPDEKDEKYKNNPQALKEDKKKYEKEKKEKNKAKKADPDYKTNKASYKDLVKRIAEYEKKETAASKELEKINNNIKALDDDFLPKQEKRHKDAELVREYYNTHEERKKNVEIAYAAINQLKDKEYELKTEIETEDAVLKVMRGKRDAIQAELDRELAAITEVKKESESLTKEINFNMSLLADEYRKNSVLCGYDNLDQMTHHITDCIDKNGNMKNDVQDSVTLFEERRKMLEEYGNGELGIFWEAFIKNDDILCDLIGSEEFIAKERIEKLYEQFAPLARALQDEYAYIAEYFIEDKLPKLLEKDPKDEGMKDFWQKLDAMKKQTSVDKEAERLKYEENKKSILSKENKVTDEERENLLHDLENHHAREQKKLDESEYTFWKEELQTYRDGYFAQTMQGTKEINKVLFDGASDTQKNIAKFMMYEDEDTQKQIANRKAKYRKWWFRTSKNTGVELVAQKHKQTKYAISMRNAMDVVYAMQYAIIADASEVQKLTNTGVTADMYAKYEKRFFANNEKAEIAFLMHVLKEEHDMIVPEDEKQVEQAVQSLPEEDQKELENLLSEFKRHVRNKCVEQDAKDFAKSVEMYAKTFLEKKREVQEVYEVNKELLEKTMQEKLEKTRAEKGEVMQQKYRGRKLMDEKLFGGLRQQLQEFGEKKQTLVYKPEKAKLNKKVKSKGEEKDDELLEKAKEYFKLSDKEKAEGKTEYPGILAECLDEYCRVNHRYYQRIGRMGDKVAGWFVDGVDDDIKMQANRLKLIAEVASGENGVEEEARDMFIVYAAKYVQESVFSEEAIKKLAEEFKPYYEKIKEAEAIKVNDPALKRMLSDACEKNRAYLFLDRTERGLGSNYATFRDMIDAQKAYFAYADRAWSVIDQAMLTNHSIKIMDAENQQRYRISLHEYFTEQILKESAEGKVLDEEALKNAVCERIKDANAREALMLQGESISNEDYEKQLSYAGELTKKDFERAIFATRKKELMKKYKSLNDDERSILALSLYCSRLGQHGSQQVIYGQRPEMVREDRNQILRYMRGEKVNFKVDYNRAIRALSTKSKNFKISGDTKLFREGMDFVEMVNRRREELRVKDFSRMSDSKTIAKEADAYRRKIAKDVSGLPSQKKQIDKIQLTDKKAFFDQIKELAVSDRKIQKSQGLIGSGFRAWNDFKENTGIATVMARVNKMNAGEKALLIYVLQDRTALDYTSAGKDKETKVVGHANAEKRFEIYDKLMTEEGRMKALREVSSPDVMRKAMMSLFSFQLRDDKPLSAGKLKAEDFVESSLKRVESLDWELLAHACDFIDEIKNDQRRKLAVRQAKMQVLNPSEANKDSKAVKFYNEKRLEFKTANNMDTFDDVIKSAYFHDKKDVAGFFNSGKELDDMMTGYNSLSPLEKKLFVKCLQNRDILDVSQKNLYWNLLGRAERDYVSPKERDELIDEFLDATLKGEEFELGDATCHGAFLSLMSTQVNDDMDFTKIEGSNWAYENLNVNNQLLVTDERKATRIDWKLFERALQFVTRTVRERNTSAYDDTLYRTMKKGEGDGPLKMDRSYMRKNLHHTGARFMRFLAKEGYAQIEDKMGLFEKAADFAGFVVSTKTSNFLHEQANIMKAQEEKEKEKEDEDEDKKEEEAGGLLQSVMGMVADSKEQYDALKELKDQVKDTYKEYKGVFVEEEKEEKKTDELSDELKGIKLEKKKSFFELVTSSVEMTDNLKEMADKYLLESPQMLETADKYIKKLIGDKLTATKIAGWYESGSNWVGGKIDDFSDFAFNSHFGADNGFKQFLEDLVDKASAVTGFLEKASKYVNPAIEIIGEFKNIVEAGVNIYKLNKAKDEGVEAGKEDRKKIEALKNKDGVSADDFELVKEGEKDRMALLNSNNSLTKSIQGRKIIDSIGKLGQKGVKLAKLKGADKIISVAVDFVNFFYKCMSDKSALLEYYRSGGAGEVEKIMEGRRKLKDYTSVRKMPQPKDISIGKDSFGQYNINGDNLDMLQRALGFERREEFADYLRLNMVNSLLFSASDYNPLMQPKILAKIAMAVLGLEDMIGKTDAASAQKIFMKLKD